MDHVEEFTFWCALRHLLRRSIVDDDLQLFHVGRLLWVDGGFQCQSEFIRSMKRRAIGQRDFETLSRQAAAALANWESFDLGSVDVLTIDVNFHVVRAVEAVNPERKSPR